MCVTTATEYEHNIWRHWRHHYSDVIMSAMTCQITRVSILCSTVCSGADKTKHQGSATLPFVRGNHQSPVASPHKGSATPKMFPFDDVIMTAMSISHDELIPRIPFRMLSIVLIFTWRDLFIYFSQLHRSIPSIPYWTHSQYMMTSSNRNIFRVTGPLWGEFTGHQRIPLKASDVELWCFLDLHLNKRLSKQSRRRWFETPSLPLWRHCNESCRASYFKSDIVKCTKLFQKSDTHCSHSHFQCTLHRELI